MVGPLEQAILALMIFVIMLGMGASLTPRDFYLALRRPYGLAIGVISQYGFMPFLGFLLATLLTEPETIAIGILIMTCMPGGTTSHIFTYFSKGNLALSVLMTVTSTVAGVLLIPIILVLYANALDLDIPRENIIATLVLLLVPVGIGMVLRRISANVGAVTEFFGSALALLFIVFLIVSWVPRNWQFLLETTSATYIASIGLGLFRIYLCAQPAPAPAQCPDGGVGDGDPEWAVGGGDHCVHLWRWAGRSSDHGGTSPVLVVHRDHFDPGNTGVPAREHRC